MMELVSCLPLLPLQALSMSLCFSLSQLFSLSHSILYLSLSPSFDLYFVLFLSRSHYFLLFSLCLSTYISIPRIFPSLSHFSLEYGKWFYNLTREFQLMEEPIVQFIHNKIPDKWNEAQWKSIWGFHFHFNVLFHLHLFLNRVFGNYWKSCPWNSFCALYSESRQSYWLDVGGVCSHNVWSEITATEKCGKCSHVIKT